MIFGGEGKLPNLPRGLQRARVAPKSKSAFANPARRSAIEKVVRNTAAKRGGSNTFITGSGPRLDIPKERYEMLLRRLRSRK